MPRLSRIKSLMEFPLKHFPQASGRFDDLYNLRANARLSDGYFLLKCDPNDHFTSSFPLMMESTGAYMLGRIVAARGKHRPEKIYYDVVIHGGAQDVTCFATNPEELASILVTLNVRGMEYVFVENEEWGLTDDDDGRPFDEVMSEFPCDARFAAMFGGDLFTNSEKRLEEYFEQ